MRRYDVAVLGAGKFGAAIARRMRRADMKVAVGSRRCGEPEVQAIYGMDAMPYEAACEVSDVVILAVPWGVAEEVVARLKPALAGKIVVDATNPVTPDWSRLDVGQGAMSGAERIAAVVEGAEVVKAFNGLKAELVEGGHHDAGRQVWYCGDSTDAKAVVREIAERCGYRAVDCGQLENALCLEAAALLWIKMAYWEGWGEDLRLLLEGGRT